MVEFFHQQKYKNISFFPTFCVLLSWSSCVVTCKSRNSLSFGIGVEVGGNIDVLAFNVLGAMDVKPDPTLSVSSSESPPFWYDINHLEKDQT